MEASIWVDKQIKLKDLNNMAEGTLAHSLGIEFTEVLPRSIKGRMPVDERTIQPIGILHGGASLALAETLSSTAAYLTIDRKLYYCVGMEINANHIKQVMSGWVIGVAEPIHLGRSTQIWGIKIYDEANRLICISRITLAILSLSKAVNRI